MNKITYIVLLILIPLCAFSASNQSSFEIYLVKNDNADLQQVEIYSKPILTAADIMKYDWNKHEIVLTNKGLRKLPKENDTTVLGKSFVVIANGIRCYKGAFWTSIWSVSHPNPIINIGPRLEGRSKNIISIERAYPSENFAIGPDPRNNNLIYKALFELNKIHE